MLPLSVTRRRRQGYVFQTLDLDFTKGVLPTFINYAGGTNGTYTDTSGSIVPSVAGMGRFDYDPVTHASLGIMNEESRANVLLNSLIDGTNLSTQSVTVTAQAYTLSFYGTGTITLSGAAVASVVGTGNYPSRKTYTFTPTAGSLTLTVTGTVKFAQLEAGGFATSFIPTAGTAVTRAQDVVRSIGLLFPPWFTQSGIGTFIIEARPYAGATVGKGLFTLNDGTANNNTTMYYDTAGNSALYMTNGGVTQVSFPTVAGSPLGIFSKFGVAYATNDVAYCVNGGALNTDNTASPPTVTRLILASTAYTEVGNMHIKRLRYFPYRLSNSELQSLTT